MLNATAGLCRDMDTLPATAAGLNCSRVFAQGWRPPRCGAGVPGELVSVR